MGNQRYSVGEYLQRERIAHEKHEYRDGRILMMATGSSDHSLITTNVIGELGNHLRGKPCRVYDSNLRIRVPRKILYTYPDVSVICSPAESDPNDPSGETTLNPRLFVEVLSPSTEAYDRGEKLHRYLQLDSLREYVLVTQVAPRVETLFRNAEGAWVLTRYSELEAVVKPRSLDIDLPLTEVYAGIEFPAS